MIKVTENIQLQPILSSDSDRLFTLMKEVYPLAYAHFWQDNGDWYVNTQYSKENILKELSQEKTEYYFVLFKGEIIGNFRIIWDEELEGLSEEKQVKLHRIYLHKNTQGNGIGKTLLSWLDKKAKEKGYTIIWLDAMDAQPQAFQFYKKLGYKYHSHTFLPFDLLHDEVRKMSQVYKVLEP
ncbi:MULTISPECIES: GNAT family N-acetyltransferase [Tenacibaculum]|uniref:GNAT family N-acetyltransferase n=1 Tax=Tenacibaculum TaxID=104267 RepID=UPI001F0A7EB8|nr:MULTISPECIES: GNAT family N-acetyltransferase [Tenacibaculum]MCH3881330.1 GNAT family N-acetyltransferase [Tenacibaculum aquimarinum]MDO6599076.1 GNAT family N-acetyltransferase [Tenacibaculum sp. 1_MG-2023]